eukprot:jgi/Tetstr1/451247/TSEL_038283.t1
MTVTLSYINLDTRADRREFFEEQVQRLGLDFKRKSAITPADLKPDEIARFCSEGQGIRPVELACIKSHLAMVEDFVSTGEALGAFFEDDALLSDTLPQFLKDYEDNGGFGYGLIRLDHARRIRLFPASRTTSTNIALHQFRSTLTGAAGYLLTRDAALKLAAYNGWGERVFDHALYDPFSRPGNLLMRANVNPALVVQFASRGETRENSEDKIRIVLDGLRGEDSIAELCRKEGIAQSLYYTWSKEFMEAGKRRLAGDTARAATTDEVKELRRQAGALKECVADLTLENRLLKKSMIADGDDDA